MSEFVKLVEKMQNRHTSKLVSESEEQTPINPVIEDIAKKHLYVPSLKVVGRDQYDFHDIHVNNIKNALLHAYNAGKFAKGNRVTNKAGNIGTVTKYDHNDNLVHVAWDGTKGEGEHDPEDFK